MFRHPRILDSILDHASPEALLALRATSRELHDEAYARLFEHVSMNETYRDGRDMVSTLSPCGSTLTFEWMRCRVAKASNDDDLYIILSRQRPREKAARRKLREKVESRLKATLLGAQKGSAWHWVLQSMPLRTTFALLFAWGLHRLTGGRGSLGRWQTSLYGMTSPSSGSTHSGSPHQRRMPPRLGERRVALETQSNANSSKCAVYLA